MKDFRYQIVTSEQDDYVNTRGKLNFAEFNFNDHRYGPMRLDISANHLHGPTLVKLDQAIGQIPFEGVDPALLRKQYIDTIKKNGIPLLQNDPKVVINEFYLKMPSGEAKLEGDLGVRACSRPTSTTHRNSSSALTWTPSSACRARRWKTW